MNTPQIVVVCLVACTALVGIILAFTLPNNDNDDSPTTTRVLSYMDQTAEPCHDFFRYVCGSWVDNTELPLGQGSYDSFAVTKDVMFDVLATELSKPASQGEADSRIKARDFYKSCMDAEAIENGAIGSLKNLIDDLGHWPMAEGIVLPGWSLDQWLDMFFRFTSKANSQPWFVATIGKDEESATSYILKADQPELFLISETYYTSNDNSKRNQELRTAYIQYVADLAELYCYDLERNTDECDRASLEYAADLVYSQEADVAELTVPISDRSANSSLTFLKRTLGEFNETYPIMTGYIYKKTFQMMYPDKEITDDMIINDGSAPFFEKWDPYFSGPADQPWKNESTMANLLVFRTIVTMIDTLPERYQEARDRFNLVRYGTDTRENRMTTCVFMADQALTFPVGAIYVEAAFPEESRETAVEMMDEILDTFSHEILDEQNDWMDESTKNEAHQKANMAIKSIGYPDYILHDTDKMDKDYERLTISGTDMLQNLVNSQVLRYKRTLEWLDQPVDRYAWIRNGYDQGPAITNAWYDPTVNSITIAAGIIAPVFFGQDQPMSINYGGLAMVLGHELIHGFDDTGRHYGPVGNKYDWWSAESAANFDQRAQCISDQYSGYYWDQAGSNLDGANENGENIADNGGIRISYEAYQKWQSKNSPQPIGDALDYWTQEQQFFIGYGQMFCSKYTDKEAESRVKTDVHAPKPFRVLGPLSNYEEFSRVFQCQPGDTYYPPNDVQNQRCRVW